MKNTNLLELVNHVLLGMNSNQVTTLSQTIEAQQVALIARDSYEYLEELQHWDHKLSKARLQVAPQTAEVNAVGIPEGIQKILEVRYEIPRDPLDPSGSKLLKLLKYQCPKDFIEAHKEELDDTLQIFMRSNGSWPQSDLEYYIKNDKEPDCWTVIDHSTLIVDSYNQSREITIDSTKFQLLAYVKYVFDETDDDQDIEIPSSDWQLYKSMVVSKSWHEIKQTQNPVADLMAKRLLTRSHNRDKRRVTTQCKGVDYGRK